MPLQKATNSEALMTQYEMHGVEALGLLKFDFLGLSNLTILRNAVDLVRENKGVGIDLDDLPLEDPKTFELLASGETTGVFQLESAGMRRYIRELRPSSVYDLAAMVALYRPGPMDNIPAYIRRKHGEEQVTYLHPLLEPYLEKTYGIFVYQEDIMAAAMALGGFTGPEADTLGYAIRKKKSSVLRSMREKFVTQAAERGVAADTIDAVFTAFQPFERYGFNKAHATCYGLVAYQTAYLKANYTVEYMTAVLSAFRDNAEKVAAAIAECRRMGIAVLPPDVHRSGVQFTVEGSSIRFGLIAVKNVGEGAIESIVRAREEGGEFRSLADLCSRIDTRLANKRVLESLAKVGALNAFGHPAQILEGLDDALAVAQAAQRDRISGQTSLFDMAADESTALEKPLPTVSEEPVRRRLAWEKELMGLYLSEHPMGEVADRVGDFVNAYSGDLRDESLDGQRVVVGGIVVGLRSVITKSKQTMAVVTLEDLQGAIEVVVFPRTYEQTGPVWQEGAILLVAGRIDHRGEEVSLLADLVLDWESAVSRGPEAFARDVAAGDRSRSRGNGGGRWAGANGNGNGNAYGAPPRPTTSGPPRPAVSPGPTRPPAAPAAATSSAPAVPFVSPLRAGARPTAGSGPSAGAVALAAPPLQPAEPVPTYLEPPGAALAGPERDEEPPLPDEARGAAAQAAQASTQPTAAGSDAILHVRFSGAAGTDRLVSAMEAFKALMRDRPGGTRVVLHVPSGAGDLLPMELRRGVAYDPDLLNEITRRVGAGLVEIQLA
jgi:DNA polymerase-3 subunit alpha